MLLFSILSSNSSSSRLDFEVLKIIQVSTVVDAILDENRSSKRLSVSLYAVEFIS